MPTNDPGFQRHTRTTGKPAQVSRIPSRENYRLVWAMAGLPSDLRSFDDVFIAQIVVASNLIFGQVLARYVRYWSGTNFYPGRAQMK